MTASGQKIGWMTAMALVIANMVGTGAFTTLGLQLQAVQCTWTIVALWLLGGIVALCGALSYAELGTHLPRSGGEYHFLSETIHPLAGYLSGWISLTVGFAAPVALAAMAFSDYLEKYLPGQPAMWAVVSVMLVSTAHSLSLRSSSALQDGLTLLKVGVMLALIAFGFALLGESNALRWGTGWKQEMGTAAFAVSLIYVTYAYSGWNAAAYIVDEIRRARRNIPIALIGGTLLVTCLYLGLQLAFLRQAPLEVLQGEVEVGQLAAEYHWGEAGGKWVSVIIAAMLLSSISAMVWVGPRVIRRMSEDYPGWRGLAVDNAAGIPVASIWLQALISIAMILSGSFEAVLVYSGFVLQLSTAITVFSVFLLRRRSPSTKGFRSWGYPLPQVFFLVVSAWVLVYLLIDRPWESLLGMGNLLLGYGTYLISRGKGEGPRRAG